MRRQGERSSYYSGTMPYGTNNQLTFTLTTPYVYQGENLLIDLQRVRGSNYTNQVSFYGINAPRGSSYQTFGNNGAQSFLPQITINYSNIGRVTGNKDFFSSISYEWTDEKGNLRTSTLDSVATDPDQIIAMIREVYVNPAIPGNYKRGYTASGADDSYSDVLYSGVGELVDNNNYIVYNDKYGWDVHGDVCSAGTYRNYQYWYLNPNQYKPQHDGLTLLLVEALDKFDPSVVSISAEGGYTTLRDYVKKTIKSARVITNAKRTGNTSDFSSGTLFKIDCDKMNEFYLLAKGQMRWVKTSYYATGNSYDFYSEPCYLYRSNYIDGFVDPSVAYLFAHMFEQFSPAGLSDETTKNDIYQELVGMKSFGVLHDCVNVPYVQTGHQFKMYGDDSDAADCQDVRDMMFFVPDYRMMYDSGRANGDYQDYVNYNKSHQPTMGLFVIRQDEIPAGTKISSNESTTTDPAQLKGLYKHQLKWYSNLDDFLPSDDQYYELWELVVDEFGKESYQPSTTATPMAPIPMQTATRSRLRCRLCSTAAS